MNVPVRNFGYGYEYGVSAFSVEVGTRANSRPWDTQLPKDGNILSYKNDVTPEDLAAVQANSDRFCGDHTWEMIEEDDELDQTNRTVLVP